MIVDDFKMPATTETTTAWTAEPYTMSDQFVVPYSTSDQFTFSLNPVGPRNITITSPDGRSATVGFDGSEVAFSGDLPVGEAARLFFECVFWNIQKGK